MRALSNLHSLYSIILSDIFNFQWSTHQSYQIVDNDNSDADNVMAGELEGNHIRGEVVDTYNDDVDESDDSDEEGFDDDNHGDDDDNYRDDDDADDIMAGKM